MKNVNFLTNSKTILGVIFCLSIVTINAQNVVIPDPNFKNALLNHDPVIDTNGDGEIQYSEAEAFTGTINVSDKGLYNTLTLLGLEAFINITGLDISHNDMAPVGGGSLNFNHYTSLTSIKCNSNQFENIDVSGLPNLEFLHCSDNNLTGLNLTGASALKTLWASNNQLTTIDVSNNTALENLSVQNNSLTGTLDVTASPNLMYLQCFDNDLTEIDVQNLSLTLLEVYNNPSLEILYCSENDLTALDLTGLLALEILQCDTNQLTSLDVSANPALESLYCYSNQLTSLDVSANPALRKLSCSTNQLTSLDVSANPALEYLFCHDSQLTNLNAANGNNANILSFSVENNNLSCIQIDSGFTPPTDGTWTKDPETEYSADCAMGVSDTDEFALSIYPNPVKDILTIDSQKAVEKIEVYDLSGKKLMSLNGQKQVNMSSLAPGTYILRILLGKTVETVKIIKK